MLGATCYAHRHPDLLRSFCGGSLENCDVVALGTHFESDAGPPGLLPGGASANKPRATYSSVAEILVAMVVASQLLILSSLSPL